MLGFAPGPREVQRVKEEVMQKCQMYIDAWAQMKRLPAVGAVSRANRGRQV